MTTLRHTSAKELVDLERGTISREIFVSEELYAQELERVFARTWLFIGHESQIPKPGDFFVSRMAEESVILCRDRQGAIHVFLNTCRHRGMKVCRYDEGNTPVFSCPYHGWSYSTDGKLVGVPHFKTAYHEALDKSQWGLVEVPQMVNYKGMIWANWDPEAPSFEAYLGDMGLHLDLAIDAPDGGGTDVEVWGGVHKWVMPCNWKFAAENFIGDFYHGGPTHRSVDIVGISPSGRRGRHTQDNDGTPRVLVNHSIRRQGHGAGTHMALSDPKYVSNYALAPPNVDAYFRQAHDDRLRRLGDKARLRAAVGTVFPNMSYSGGRSLVVWHPAGPHRTEAWRWYFMPKDAPEEVKQTLRLYAMRYAGPSGMTEQDDMENWNYASAASNGTIARRYPYNYQMGLGFERAHEEFDWFANEGVLTQGVSEQNQRGMYARWAELMDAESWKEIERS